ncbi:MAG: zinc ribbon domain-containing protein [Eubacteriales bacterium]|jgi:ribosomal protein L40E
MSDDFFSDIGRHISRYTKKAAEQTGTFFESTKISARITGEENEVKKIYQKLGEEIFRRAVSGGAALTDSEQELVGSIEDHKEKIRVMRKQLADVKGMIICPKCGAMVAGDAAFCPKCGAEIPEDMRPDQKKEQETAEDARFEDEDADEDVAADAEFTQVTEDTDGQIRTAEYEEVHTEDGKTAAGDQTAEYEEVHTEDGKTVAGDQTAGSAEAEAAPADSEEKAQAEEAAPAEEKSEDTTAEGGDKE